MKYLKYFEEVSAYEAYKNGSDYVLPNVSYVEENDIIFYESESEKPIPQIQFPITIISNLNNEINEDNIENVKALYQYLDYKLSNAGITDNSEDLYMDDNEQIFCTVNEFDLTEKAHSYRYCFSDTWESNVIEEDNSILIIFPWGSAIILPSGKAGVHFT